MPEYYLEGEEKFGPIMSKLYSFFCHIGVARGLYDFMSSDLGKSKASRLLDVGTGTGAAPIMLAGRYPNLELYAVDPSPSMLKIARNDAAKLKNIKFGFGSSRYIPFKCKFDIIFTSLSFHHWKDKEGSLKYLATRLAKGGEIRIYEFNSVKASPLLKAISSHMSSISDIRAAAENAGLKIGSSVEKGRLLRVSLKP